MSVFADGPAPESSECAEIISQSDNGTLEKLEDAVWGKIESVCGGQRMAPPEYHEWNNYLGEIRAERDKRRGL
jgi:hypothetical protein